jgi:hypothetical protein
MKHISLLIALPSVFMMVNSSCVESQKSPFIITDTGQNIELAENGKTVFVYQKKPKTLSGRYVCNNYIHPLYDLNGNIITEESPPDHLYHRGVFWAWHQLYSGNTRLGDGWSNDSISQEVVNVRCDKTRDDVQFNLDVLWHSQVSTDGKPFLGEKTRITVHKLEAGIRKIDFEIALKALVPDLQLGGSADQKGYGGFCVRMRLPDSLIFTSENGPVTPQDLQIKAGPWMDFSGKFGEGNKISGLTILCHPDMPDYPEPWILRQKRSMQNIVFPGQARINIPTDKPVVLKYRLLIHDGNAESLNIPQLQKEYPEEKSD